MRSKKNFILKSITVIASILYGISSVLCLVRLPLEYTKIVYLTWFLSAWWIALFMFANPEKYMYRIDEEE
ncbi:MAG: hypothetical protein E6686_03725 [Lachnospiraceae bacterium]|nr:hypothetical protein [Lachnospiraceae bacterium]